MHKATSAVEFENSSILDVFRNIPFWTESGNNFNRLIGLPEKDGIPTQLFDYELDLYKVWEQFKHIWIKKSTGLGISEFFLRLMLWLCLKDNEMQGCQMCIVTGPNIDLAKKLIERMKNMLIDYPGFRFDKMTDYVLEVNKCSIQAYPSNNLGSFRSLTKPKFILLDEADFFRVGEQEEVRHVSERYIAKSNPYIVMMSTPNNPGGLFEQIENEPSETCLYNRLFLDYRVGLGKIYSIADIEKAKQSPSFEREYDLKYGVGLGNCFIGSDIDKCLTDKIAVFNPACSCSMALHAGFGSSKTGISVLMLESNKLHVLYSRELERARYEDVVALCNQLRVTYRPQKLYCDAANPEMIKSLKVQWNEAVDYERIIERARADKIDHGHRMNVVPISFNQDGRLLLERFVHVVSRQLISIPIEFNNLITEMRMAKVKDNGNLDKEEAGDNNTYDLFDSVRLCLAMFPLKAK
jgi:hypothetical protein